MAYPKPHTYVARHVIGEPEPSPDSSVGHLTSRYRSVARSAALDKWKVSFCCDVPLGDPARVHSECSRAKLLTLLKAT